MQATQGSILEHSFLTSQANLPHELKLEVPMVLSPPESVQKPNGLKQVALKDIFEFIEFPSQDGSNAELAPKEEGEDKPLMQLFEQCDKDVKDEIRDEKPDINEKTLRVQIPPMANVVVANPRKNADPVKTIAETLKVTNIAASPSDQDEEQRLNWVPMPQSLTQINLIENVDVGAPTAHSTERPDRILRSEQLLYREPGLRILDIDDEAEELMYEDPGLEQSSPADIPGKITPQKRPAEGDDSQTKDDIQRPLEAGEHRRAFSRPIRKISAGASKTENTTSNFGNIEQRQPSDPAWHSRRLSLSQQDQDDSDELPDPNFRHKRVTFGDSSWRRELDTPVNSFSAVGSLASFLDLRGSKFKRPTLLKPTSGPGSPADNTSVIEVDPILMSQQQFQPLKRSGSFRQPDDGVEVPSTPCGETSTELTIPLPDIANVDARRTIIADSALVNSRQLLLFLEEQGNDLLSIIYRDLHKVPDIILNPRACIIFISIQALTQRSLPGQKSTTYQNTPQETVQCLSLEFDCIYVVISMSARLSRPQLDIQMDVMAKFSSFCGTLASKRVRITPLWAPVDDASVCSSAQKSSLCRWTWSLICQYAFRNTVSPSRPVNEGGTVVLIQEETLWELFLRKAGLNAMAAQVILGCLKRPVAGMESMDIEGMSMPARSWGLGRFVNMAPKERVDMFSDSVGSYAIDRMNDILESSSSLKKMWKIK